MNNKKALRSNDYKKLKLIRELLNMVRKAAKLPLIRGKNF